MEDLINLGFKFNHDSELVDKTGSKFSQGPRETYIQLERGISKFILNVLKERLHFSVVTSRPSSDIKPLPSAPPSEVSTGFLMSKTIKSSDKVLILLPGAGSRVGCWSEGLCIRENLNAGAMLPYVASAVAAGFSVVIANPRLLCYDNNVRNEVYSAHLRDIWKALLWNAPKDAQFNFVAYSLGGSILVSLLKSLAAEDKHASDLLRIARIAFIDSVHSVTDSPSSRSQSQPNSTVQTLPAVDVLALLGNTAVQYSSNITEVTSARHSRFGCRVEFADTMDHEQAPFAVRDRVMAYIAPITTDEAWTELKSRARPFLLLLVLCIVSLIGFYVVYKL